MLKKHQTILLKQLFKTLKQLEALFCKLSQDHKEVLWSKSRQRFLQNKPTRGDKIHEFS